MPIEWSNFPTKNLIVRYLDYESRCNLRTCSKDDKYLIDSYHFVPYNIELSEIPSNLDTEKSILRLKIDSFTIWFIGKGEKTRIERKWNGEIMDLTETKMEDRFNVCQRFINKFLIKNGLFETVKLAVTTASIAPMDNWRIKCSKLLLVCEEAPAEWVIAWLSKVETKLKILVSNSSDTIELANMSQVQNVTQKLLLMGNCDFTNETLEKLMAMDLRISSLLITPEGVKKTLERYLKFGRRDDELVLCTNFPEGFDPIELFPNELKVKKIEGKIFQEEKLYKITGDFKNENGINGARVCRFVHTLFEVYVEPEKQKRDCLLWPFTVYQ